MAKQTVNIGSGELAGNGESIRSAFDKINDNFDELYSGDSSVDLTSIDSSIIPSQNVQYDLGSTTNRFKDLYLSGNTIYLGTATISIDGQGRIVFSDPTVSVASETVRGDIEDVNGNTIFDSTTGAVSNLAGQPGSYYLDYTNFTNTPTIPADVSDLTDTGGLIGGNAFSGAYADLTNKPGIDEIVSVGATTSRALTVGDLTVTSLAGTGGLSGFSAITGGGTGNITGYNNITAATSLTVAGQSFVGTDIIQWNTAYGWGDHSAAGYQTSADLNSDVDAHLNQNDPVSGYVLSWNGTDYVWVAQTGGDGSSTLTDLTDTTITTPAIGEILKYNGSAWINDTIAPIPTDSDSLIEGSTNFYYTQSKFDSSFAAKSTTDLSEGTNLYYTDARVLSYLTTNNYATQTYVDTEIADLSTTAPEMLQTLQDIGTLLNGSANLETALTTSISQKLAITDFDTYFDNRLAVKDTDNLSEGTTNLYFTNQRAIDAFTASGDISLSSGGAISFNNTSGYLTTVTITDIDNGSNIQTTDTWTSTDNTIATTGAIAAKISADLAQVTFDDITTTGSTTANTITVGGITTGSITGVGDTINFNNATITNVSIDYGTYSGA
jgi:hypothetical protein